mmetsp:Transcript_23884/g.70355  ORF Transcript_23884/g.70355 Transcript_23884/m.70355 type:complete len:479 (+) Transcript_23884:78-1514(+)
MLRVFISVALLVAARAIPIDIPLDAKAVTAAAEAHLPKDPAHYERAFERYKQEFGKTYADEETERIALGHFVSNDRIIEAHNARDSTYTLGHNHYSDMSWEQFRERHMSYEMPERPRQERVRVRLGASQDPPLPDSVDWVAQGCVTPVKDQGACGSCWAFSATGAIEGAYCVASEGTLISLSEQELVSCDGSEYGCGGGLMDNAFKFVEDNGICTEEDDPYASGTGHAPRCTPEQRRCQPSVIITGLKDVPAKDEEALKAAVAQQPVSVAIEADRSAFQLYNGGVFTSVSCGTQLDHGVLAVGYGTDEASGLDYWKVKNSWGPRWGESGYIRIQRGEDLCGIAMQASYPTGAKAVPKPDPPSPVPPSPPPPPAPKTHYGNPKTGCLDSELAVEVQGAPGDFCSSKCVPIFKACPRDKPAGVLAMPLCALSDQAHGVSYCALVCANIGEPIDKKANDMCGPEMSCQKLSAGMGICTYPE